MGLDMYAYKTRSKLDTLVDFSVPDDAEEISYWRKHPNLHGWMENLYRAKGGSAEQFNLAPVVLTVEDLVELEKIVSGDKLPETSGFFFGASRPEDKLDDIAFIQKALEAIKGGYTVFYDSWW